jgi:hypothetical protein
MKLYFYIAFIFLITACGYETDLKSAEQDFALENVSESLLLFNKTQLNTIQNVFKNIEKKLVINPLVNISEGELKVLNRIDSIQNLFNTMIHQLNDTSLNYHQISAKIYSFRNEITQMIGTYTGYKGEKNSFNLNEEGFDFSMKNRLDNALKKTSPADTALIANIINELTLPNTLSFNTSNKHKLLLINTIKSKLYKINLYCLNHVYQQQIGCDFGFSSNRLFPVVISRSQVVQKSDTLKFKLALAVIDSSFSYTNYYQLNGENKKINFTENNLQIPIKNDGINMIKGVVGVPEKGKEMSVPWEYKCFKK